jgi:hypothetical protein
MALPPEPLEEVLPSAVWVVDAEVKEVVAQGPAEPKLQPKTGAPAMTSTGQKVGSQTVRLIVRRVLKGDPAAKELVVEKPVGAYALRAGNKGPFLLDGGKPNPTILGRYGPDTYSLAALEKALKPSR